MPIRQQEISTAPRTSWERFLHRPALQLDKTRAAQALTGKVLLVTGAGGWIGSALTRALAELDPAHLVLLEAAERNLYELELALGRLPATIRRTCVLGSVTDAVLLKELFRLYRPQVVFHAAAFKHVPVMEQNPFAAIENNAIGTALLARAAANSPAEQFILLSTDKAVDPVSVMGASKRIAELVLLAMQGTATRMKAVRLGNVFGSEGSIVPLFRSQIEAGGPVTVTHPEVRRFFVTRADAVTLLLTAASTDQGRGVLVPDLGDPVWVREIAEHLIAQHSSGTRPAVTFTSLRPGDKLSEALLSDREWYSDGETLLRAVVSPGLKAEAVSDVLVQLQRACSERSLNQLFEALKRAVPEYQASTVIENALAAEAGARA